MDGSDAVADKWEPLLLANCLCQKLQLKLKTDDTTPQELHKKGGFSSADRQEW